jgi:pyrroline-5-carboxylate reductase
MGVLGGVGPTLTHPDRPAHAMSDASGSGPFDRMGRGRLRRVDDDRTQVELAIIGGGNMGAALIGGLLDSGAFDAASLAVVEVAAPRREQLSSMFPSIVVAESPPRCEGAVIAVKPADTPAAASAAVEAGATRLLSIAAGVRLASLEAAAGPDVAVVRAMPNTPALVRLGASAIAAGTTAGRVDVAWARTILEAVGTVDELDEVALDAFTGVAGSGPAYVFLVAEALIDAAVAEGLDPVVAERVVRRLLIGSATLLDREGDPARLREMVTSPNGTTAAGLAALDERDLRGAFGAAVRAATRRSSELG